jgi:hypothetical protein
MMTRTRMDGQRRKNDFTQVCIDRVDPAGSGTGDPHLPCSHSLCFCYRIVSYRFGFHTTHFSMSSIDIHPSFVI